MARLKWKVDDRESCSRCFRVFCDSASKFPVIAELLASDSDISFAELFEAKYVGIVPNRALALENQTFKHEISKMLGLPDGWSADCFAPQQLREDYSSLIEEYPNSSWLFARRGTCHARMRDWEAAASDYAKALKLRPGESVHSENHAILGLYMGKTQVYTAICRAAYNRFQDDNLYHKGRAAFICSLSPLSAVDPMKFAKLRLSMDEHSKWYDLIKGMTLFRASQFNEAVSLFPDSDDSFLYSLSLLFRAMTQYERGEETRANELLSMAREVINRDATFDGPPRIVDVTHLDRPIIWCAVQIVLREAEALIEPATTASADADAEPE